MLRGDGACPYARSMHYKACTGPKKPRGDGETVDTFGISDDTGHLNRKYYVLCTPSPHVHKRLICHLQPVGSVRSRTSSGFGPRGGTNLGRWAVEMYDAQCLLFA